MKLLNSEKAPVAILAEDVSKVTFWGVDPVLIYYPTYAFDKNNVLKLPAKMIVEKVETLEGYLLLDDGKTEVKIEGTLKDKLALLVKYLGGIAGGYGDLSRNLPNTTLKAYAGEDDTPATIDLKIYVHAPTEIEGAPETITLKYPRTSQALYPSDILKNKDIPYFEGYKAVGLAFDNEGEPGDQLLEGDKILTDQTLHFVWDETNDIELTVIVGEENITIKVPYGTTVEQAMELILKDDEVIGKLDDLGKKVDYVGREDGTKIGKTALKKAAGSIAKLKVVFVEEETEKLDPEKKSN